MQLFWTGWIDFVNNIVYDNHNLILRDSDHRAASSAAAHKKEVEAHAETREYLKNAAKADNNKSSTADKSKIQNQQTEIRKLNQKGTLRNDKY